MRRYGSEWPTDSVNLSADHFGGSQAEPVGPLLRWADKQICFSTIVRDSNIFSLEPEEDPENGENKNISVNYSHQLRASRTLWVLSKAEANSKNAFDQDLEISLAKPCLWKSPELQIGVEPNLAEKYPIEYKSQ